MYFSSHLIFSSLPSSPLPLDAGRLSMARELLHEVEGARNDGYYSKVVAVISLRGTLIETVLSVEITSPASSPLNATFDGMSRVVIHGYCSWL